MIWSIALIGFLLWFAAAALVALGIGRAVRIAAEREHRAIVPPVSVFVSDAMFEGRLAAPSTRIAQMALVDAENR